MRILLVVPQDEEIGGVASVVKNLAQYLITRGHQVFFLHPANTIFLKRKTTKFGFSGFDLRFQMPLGDWNPVITILAFLALFPLSMSQLIYFILRYRIQIINVHYPTDRFVYLALCRHLLPVALITSIHGADVLPGGKPETQYSRAFRFLISSSDLVVTPSKGLQKDFLAVFPKFSARTTFIHNGIDFTELNSLRTETSLCTETGSNGRAPYVLCISAYKEQKAIDVLVRAFKQVQETEPSLKLILVGAGPLRQQLETLAMSLGIQNQIEFLGQQTRPEVAKLLQGCKVFVLPSRFETFGIVILEAMAFRKPVVATTAGGIPEIIENESNGILVEPNNPDALADAIVLLLENQPLRQAIAHNGYETVWKQFGSDKTGAAYESVFTELLNSTSRKAA